MTRFEQYQNKIFEDYLRKVEKEQARYKENGYSYYRDKSIDIEHQINNSKSKKVAEIKNLANSLPMIMAKDNAYIQLSVTITFGYNRIADCNSFEEIEKCLKTQVRSGKEFFKKIRNSKYFRDKKSKKSKIYPLDKSYHYLLGIELQEEGDIHFHVVMYVRNNKQDILNMIKLIHKTRQRSVPYPQWSSIDCRRNYDVKCKRCKKYIDDKFYEIGRTHIGMSAKLKAILSDSYILRKTELKQENV